MKVCCVQVTREWHYLKLMINNHARDVFDEVDAICNPKSQHVFTMGGQLEVDGGSKRWKVAQGVLRILQSHIVALVEDFENIEYRPGVQGSFPHFRFLPGAEQDALRNQVNELIIDSVLQGEERIMPLLRSSDKEVVKEFILNQGETIEDVQCILQNDDAQNTALILRGLLSYDILHKCMGMRHRVEYGVWTRLNMAIPFCGRDVADEKREYGQPDLALFLTLLSYYQSGLSSDRLEQTFQLMNSLHPHEASVEYAVWVQHLLQCGVEVDKSIRTFAGVNFSDRLQRERLVYPLMKMNRRCIDFYLNSMVFPVESKQFEMKLVATPQDLFSKPRPSAGFSGTNGMQSVYPQPLKQNDLPELQGTDGEVLSYFMLPENQAYQKLDPCANAASIIQIVTKLDKVRVMLDVGALILEDNAKFAFDWLQNSSEDIEAAVYLTENDLEFVVTRSGARQLLKLSPYKDLLGRCICFLDDIHTRGVDLKFPPGTHAVVTLGKGVTRDRLAQAAMRMRLLGQGANSNVPLGHTIEFLASSEVDSDIRMHLDTERRLDTPNGLEVFEWARRNSVSILENAFMFWGAQSFSCCIKGIEKERFEAAMMTKEAATADEEQQEILARGTEHGGQRPNVTDPEFVTEQLRQLGLGVQEPEGSSLVEMYGGERHKEAIPGIMRGKLKRLKREKNIDSCLSAQAVIKHCQKFVREVMRFSQTLDDEQERELEQELEECRYIERPGVAQPSESKLHNAVTDLATAGRFSNCAMFSHFLRCFDNTTLQRLAQIDASAWSSRVFVTQDFICTIQDHVMLDKFLKPPRWVVIVPAHGETETVMIILSAFEVNLTLPYFRTSTSCNPRFLHMLTPRKTPDQSILFDNAHLITSGDVQPTLNQSQPLAHLAHLSGGCNLLHTLSQPLLQRIQRR